MIAREGLVPVGIAALSAAAVAAYADPAWSIPLWALTAYVLFVFRESAPDIPNAPLAVLSPGDGEVVEVAENRDPWLDRNALRVRVALEGPGIGVLRSPVEGKVMDYWTSAHRFDAPGTPRPTRGSSRGSPRCYSAWVQTDEGDDVVFAVSSLHRISRFKLYSAPGERIGFGQRMGFIYFGSVVDVYVPAGSRRKVASGNAAHAGSSVLAELARGASSAADTGQAG